MPAGYTLMELMIAMSLLVILGGGLVTLLSQCVSIWNRAETRGKVYEEARALLDRIAEDLRSAVIRTHAAEGDTWVRFIADSDPDGRQRLRFVRTVSGEAADAILREGGRYLSVQTPAVCDGEDDAKEAQQGLLAAPGGASEVLYATDPRPGMRIVWRGSRSPVGGPDSLLVDRNVEEGLLQKEGGLASGKTGGGTRPAKSGEVLAAAPEPAGAAPGEAMVECALSRVATRTADHILFLGFRFWTPGTNTWRNVPPLKDPKPGEASGPTPWWDSTRALLEVQGGANELAWKRNPGSLDDPRDDIFPELVEVTVVVGEPVETLGARLVDEATEGAKALVLSLAVELPEDPIDRFVLVDDEWIEIEKADGNRLEVAAGGRGARWTKTARHDRGARVASGVTFRRVIEVPGFRSEVREEAGTRRRGKGAPRR